MTLTPHNFAIDFLTRIDTAPNYFESDVFDRITVDLPDKVVYGDIFADWDLMLVRQVGTNKYYTNGTNSLDVLVIGGKDDREFEGVTL